MSGGSYYVPPSSKWPVLGSLAWGLDGRHRCDAGAWRLGHAGHGGRSGRDSGCHVVVVSGCHPRIPQGALRRSDGSFLSLGNGMVHFLRGDVLRRLLRRPVLYPNLRAAVAGWRRRQGSGRAAVARLHGFLAIAGAPDAAIQGPEQTFSPWHLPLVNTLILVGSSITLTVAHEGLKEGHRDTARHWLTLTVLLGLCFIAIQASSTGRPMFITGSPCRQASTAPPFSC